MKMPIAVLIYMFLVSPALTDEALFLRLTSETASCIAHNRQTIEAQTGSVVYIYPPTCPNRPDNPLSVFTTAEAPDIAGHLRKDETGPDRLIILSRSQLGCFDNLPAATNVNLWRFYPENCTFEPEP